MTTSNKTPTATVNFNAIIQTLVSGVVLSIVSVVLLRNTSLAVIVAITALIIAGLSTLYPPSTDPFFRFMSAVASRIGKCLTWAILTLVYFLVVTPYGWGLKLFRSESIERVPNRDCDSYWVKRTREVDKSQYFKQY